MMRPVTPERINRAAASILRRHLDLPAQRRIAVSLQQRRGLHRIALELGARGGARNRRQDDGREQADDGEHAQDFDQRETPLGGALSRSAATRRYAMSVAVPLPPS